MAKRQAGAADAERNASEYLEIVGKLHPHACVYAGGARYADLVWRTPAIDKATLDAEIESLNRLYEKVEVTPEMAAAGANALAGVDTRSGFLEEDAEDIYRVMAAVKARNGGRDLA